MGNFQGTYVRPGDSWDLKGCRQKPNESLRDYVRRFSKQCTELPSVTHVKVINAFLEGTTCRNLVHELARSRPVNTNELFDAATNYAAGEEAVDAIFDDMLKKPCPYHKGPVNHTLEQCEMLKKYYNRIAYRDEDKKKDAGDDPF